MANELARIGETLPELWEQACEAEDVRTLRWIRGVVAEHVELTPTARLACGIALVGVAALMRISSNVGRIANALESTLRDTGDATRGIRVLP